MNKATEYEHFRRMIQGLDLTVVREAIELIKLKIPRDEIIKRLWGGMPPRRTRPAEVIDIFTRETR